MASGKATVANFISSSVASVVAATPRFTKYSNGPPGRIRPLDIVIPIFNNASGVRACLAALLPTLSDGDQVWLIDDASTDAEAPQILEAFSSQWPSTKIIRNPYNLGFVGTANRALKLTDLDVVLLNSDTRVTENWLEFLQDTLENHPDAGVVCPLSDNASILSVIPQQDEREVHSNARASVTPGATPIPTAVGFCMLIKRELLEEIGGFCRLFSPGYGEECDFSMRAMQSGWNIMACERSVVYHSSAGSFGEQQSSKLQDSHQAKLDKLWPEYVPLVQSWWRDNPLRAKAEHEHWRRDQRPGVVHVLHREYEIGGTERITRDLIAQLLAQYRNTLLYPGRTTSAWCDFEQRRRDGFRELMLNDRWIRPKTTIAGDAHDLTCPHSERALARVIRGSGSRVVHFHHMLHWDSLMLPALAKALGCRTVISVHDFWFNCPVYNQLEFGTASPCGRSRAQPDQRCLQCLSQHANESGRKSLIRPEFHQYTVLRHQIIQHALQTADRVLVPSRFMKDRLLAGYTLDDADSVQVLSHGVRMQDRSSPQSNGEKKVIAFFGGDQVLKGAKLVLQMARAVEDAGVRIRIYGHRQGFDEADLPANVELHGYFLPQDISHAMKGVDLALLPSFFEESFSMILSECWAHGVPVLASSRGALAERISHGQNGWLVPDQSPESWTKALRDVLQGDLLSRCKAWLSEQEVFTVEQQAEQVGSLYQKLLDMPALNVPQESAQVTLQRFHRKVDALRDARPRRPEKVTTRCLGLMRNKWATAQYRVRLPLMDLAQSGNCVGSEFHVLDQPGFDLGAMLEKFDGRRLAIQPFIDDSGLEMMEYLHRLTGLRLTLVVDDLWTNLPPDNPVRSALPKDVSTRLSYAADFCESLVLTTAPLKDHLGIEHDNIHVINNALPEWIWNKFPKVEPEPQSKGKIRIGWAGAPQHMGDLAFLEPVMRATTDIADWVFLGMCPESLKPLAAEIHPIVPFDQYPATLAALRLDIGVAPLTDHPFNRCKSNLKVLEYGILGVPVVAADIDPYHDCPVDLAALDNADDWTDRLLRLANDKEARIERGRMLRDWVKKNHLSQHRRCDWRAAMGIEQDDH